MGNDGGSIPTRRELVKEATRNPSTTQIKESIQEQQEYGWNIDPLSLQPLASPVVSDSSGRLFNKDSIIEFLLPGSDNTSKRTEHERILQGGVKSLRDVVELKFEIGLAASSGTKNGKNHTKRAEKWICPITNRELGPKSKAVYVVPCGHVFSEATLKEVSQGICLQCDESYTPDNVIPILTASEPEITSLDLRIKSLHERGLSHSLKKIPGSNKKRKRVDNGHSDSRTAHNVGAINTPENSHEKSDSKHVRLSGQGVGTIKNVATASLTAKVMEEQKLRQTHIGQNENIQSLFTKTSETGQNARKGRDIDFMNRGFAIPNK